MKLTTEKGRREAERQRRARAVRGRRRVLNAVIATLAIGALLLGGAVAIGGRTAVEANAREWIGALRNYASAWLAAAPVDSLRIDIKFKYLHLLHTKRDAALEQRWLVPRREDFVSASIATAARDVPVRLRLIGPESRFVAGDLWSLEVRVEGDGHIQGMRRFALYPPAVLDGSTPLVAAAHFERIGLIGPRTLLLEVAMNGDELGLAAAIELPSRELLRARGKRDAPIVHLDAAPYWAALAANGVAGPYDNPHIASVVASRKARRDDDDTATAVGLLRAFLDGRLAASEVFALDETARWLAAAEFWGDASALHWTRSHFYLDPLTARLAPFASLPGLDAARPRAAVGELVSARSALGARLLADPALRSRFARELRDLGPPPGNGRGSVMNRESTLLSALQRRQTWVLQRIHREAPFTRPLDLRAILQRASSLGALDPDEAVWFEASIGRGDFDFPRVVSAYARTDDEGPFLDLLNLLPVPVSVATLRHDENGAPGTPVTLASRVRFPIALPATAPGATPTAVRVRYRQPNAAAVSDAIRGVAQIAGSRDQHPFLARRSIAPLLAHPVPVATLEEALAAHPFLYREPGDSALHTSPGQHTVEGSLVLPPDVGLVIEAGTELSFGSRAALVATASLDMRGTADAPVVLRGAPRAKGPRWQGIALLGSARPSRWTHARILDAKGIDRRGWRLPAAVTVRGATLEVERAEIARSGADQALAIADGRLAGSDLHIVDSAGTALWLRGARVELDGLRIEGAGRLGVDAADSTLSLRGGSLRRIRATALEAADRSELEIREVEISDVSVAASAKNGGRLRIHDSAIDKTAHVPLLAFTDRPELGGGQIVANLNTISASRKALAQLGSKVLVDGVPSETVDAPLGDLQID